MSCSPYLSLSLSCCVCRVYLSPTRSVSTTACQQRFSPEPQLGILTRLLAFGLAFCGAPVYCTCQLNGIVNATHWIFFFSSFYFFSTLILFSFYFLFSLSVSFLFVLHWNHLSSCSVGVNTWSVARFVHHTPDVLLWHSEHIKARSVPLCRVTICIF